MFSQRRWWFIGVLVLLTIVGWYWYGQRSSEPDLVTINPVRQDLERVLEATGRVEAKERVQMRFALGGKVVYLGAQSGEYVQRGQTIASLDQRSVQKVLDKNLSLYQTQRWGYEESQSGRGDGLALDESGRRLAEMDQFALERSVLDVQIQALTIENYRLSAPFSGVLVSSPVAVAGVNIGATDFFDLANPETLYFRVFIDEVDIDSVYVGQTATVTLDAITDEPLSAVVEKIAFASIDTGSGTVFPVELKFVSPVSIDRHRLGMNGDAHLVLERKAGVLSVPLSALINRNGDTYVSVKRGSVVEEVRVELGIESETAVEILSGLTEADEVVLP